MSFSPDTFTGTPGTAKEVTPPPQGVIEKLEDIEEETQAITLQPDIALGFQIMLMKEYFKEEDKHGNMIEQKIDHDSIISWAHKYGKAFRDYCKANPIIAAHISAGKSILDEEKGLYVYEKSDSLDMDKRLLDEEVEELLKYLRKNEDKTPERFHEEALEVVASVALH